MAILYYICIHVWLYVHECHGLFLYFGDITQYYGSLWTTYFRGRIWGDTIFTPPRLYGSWQLGKNGWGVDMMSLMLDIPGSTPMWAHSIRFWVFILYQYNIYINDFQTYSLYKRTLVVSDLVLARRGSENDFQPPNCF